MQKPMSKATDSSRTRDDHRHTRRGPSRTTMTATLFAMTTIMTLAAIIGFVWVIFPLPIGIRALPELPMPFGSDMPPADSVPVASLIEAILLLYASSRLTRNATLESDRVRSVVLRKAWIAMFEILWVVLFVAIGESLAICIDSCLGSPADGMASWGMLSTIAITRCLLARRDHNKRHTACEALRSIGCSGLACVTWETALALLLPYGIPQEPVLLAIVIVSLVASVVAIARLLLAEGRHKDKHSH